MELVIRLRFLWRGLMGDQLVVAIIHTGWLA